jgi:hypothetical protein
MKNYLDEIIYGNPTDDFLPYLRKGGYDYVYEELKEYPFPPNSSESAKDELRMLLDYQNLPEQQDEKLVARYIDYDNHLIDIFKNYCKNKIGEDMDAIIDELIEESKYLIVKLKFHYQRIRPYQLAGQLKAKLFPFKSVAAINPSYPSGHTFQARMLTEYIGNKHPQHYEPLANLTNDVATSRMFLGLHFQSDNDFAHFCAKKLIQSKQFTSKYGI